MGVPRNAQHVCTESSAVMRVSGRCRLANSYMINRVVRNNNVRRAVAYELLCIMDTEARSQHGAAEEKDIRRI